MQYDQTFMIKEKLNTENSQYKNNGQNNANAHIHTIYLDRIYMSPFKWTGNTRLVSDSYLENLKEKKATWTAVLKVGENGMKVR